MPCRDGCNSGPTREQNLEKINKGLENKISFLESLICSACTILEQQKFNFSANPALDEWWDKHKKEDEQKAKNIAWAKAKEAIKLKKIESLSNKKFKDLTKEEKKFLKENNIL